MVVFYFLFAAGIFGSLKSAAEKDGSHALSLEFRQLGLLALAGAAGSVVMYGLIWFVENL